MAVAIKSTGLTPAVEKVIGMDPSAGPQPTRTEYEVHNYVKP